MKYKENLQKITLLFVLLTSVISIDISLRNSQNAENVSRPQDPLSSDTLQNGITIVGNTELDTFCAGNGTTGLNWSDAHVIEDIIFNTYISMETCLSLINISRYVKIQNLTFLTSQIDDGLFLQNCTNFEISDILIQEANYGIRILDSINVSIFDSEIDSNPSHGFSYGIGVFGGENISIFNFTSNIKSGSYNYHAIFEDGYNFTIEQCGFQTDGGGIVINNCTEVKIHNNNFTNIPDFLLNFLDSSDISFYNNTCTNVGDSVIQGGSNTSIFNNSLVDSETIDFRYHHNFTVAENTITSSNGDTIGFQSSYNGTFRDNNITGGGLTFWSTNYDLNILESNLLNGKPIKYFENQDYITENFDGYGQLILNNVDSTIVSNMSLSGAFRELVVIGSTNITIQNCSFTDTFQEGYGIYFSSVDEAIIVNCSFSSCHTGVNGYVDDIQIENCVFDGNFIPTYKNQIQFNNLANFSISNTSIQNCVNGISSTNIENFYGKNNRFINTTYDFKRNQNVDFDTSNLMDGIPIYYLTHKFNLTYNMAHAGGFIIDNCSYLLFSHGSIILNSTPVQIFDSHHIVFHNYSIVSYGNNGFEIANSHNVSIIYCNISGPDIVAFYIDDSRDVNITRNYVYDIDGLAYLSYADNVFITENWFENFTDGFEGGDVNCTIEDNALVNYSGNLTEESDLEDIDLSGNFNTTSFDPEEFGDFQFNLDNFWTWTTSDSGTGQTTTTGTDTTTDTTSIDPPNPLPTWVIIVIVAVGVAIIIAIIIIVRKNT